MNKITVLGLINERTALLKSLMELGVVDINEEEPSEEIRDKVQKPHVQAELLKVDSQLSDITRAIDIMNRYAPVKKPMFSARRIVSEQDYTNIMDKADNVISKVDQINCLEDEIVKMKSEENRVVSIINSLTPWLNMEIPLDVASTRYVQCFLGTVPVRLETDVIEAELQKVCPEVFILKGVSDRENHYIAVVFHKSGENEIQGILRNYGFNRINLRDVEGTAKESKERLEKKLASLCEKREQKMSMIKDLARERERIEVVSDGFRMEHARIEARSRLISTRSTFMLKGWVPAKMSGKVEELLSTRFFCSVNIKEPDRDEEFPVLLENGPVVESISPVMNMYGVPSSGEIDPSPVMMPFFVLFFGFMLGDGGYGILMSAVTGWILLKKQLEYSTRCFIKLIFFCGLATTFAGILTGSWFGISSLTKTAVWLVPTEQPQVLMSWVMLFGIIHMFIGLFIKALNLIRHGQIVDAIFDVFFQYILLTGFVLTLLPFAPGVDTSNLGGLIKVGNMLFIVGVALLLLTQGRKSKSIFGKIFGGVPKLYDLISFFSDILSYIRLMALSLASGIIGDIVNTMGMNFSSIIVKVLVGTLILVFGHTINLGINALGAYVHSCRLQYLEFFGKFLEAGGQAFKPFKADTQYIVVKNEILKFLQSGEKSRVA